MRMSVERPSSSFMFFRLFSTSSTVLKKEQWNVFYFQRKQTREYIWSFAQSVCSRKEIPDVLHGELSSRVQGEVGAAEGGVQRGVQGGWRQGAGRLRRVSWGAQTQRVVGWRVRCWITLLTQQQKQWTSFNLTSREKCWGGLFKAACFCRRDDHPPPHSRLKYWRLTFSWNNINTTLTVTERLTTGYSSYSFNSSQALKNVQMTLVLM